VFEPWLIQKYLVWNPAIHPPAPFKGGLAWSQNKKLELKQKPTLALAIFRIELKSRQMIDNPYFCGTLSLGIILP